MATPIGHAIAGYAAYKLGIGPKVKGRVSLVLLCVFASIAPDLDVIPGIIAGKPALYHQGISHSLGLAALLGLAVALLYRMSGREFSAIFVLWVVSYSSHLAIDLFGPDSRLPLGIPIFWPISGNHFIAPFPVFLGMRHAAATSSSVSEWLQGIVSLYNLVAIGVEIVLVTPFIYLSKWLRGATSKFVEHD